MAKGVTVAVTDAAAILVAAVSAHPTISGQTRVTSGSPAAEVTAGHNDRWQLIISNPAGGSTVYLGSSAVTSAAGMPLGAGDDLSVTIPASEALYAICGIGGTATLRALVVAL